eukprot:Awhi_evm3s8584
MSLLQLCLISKAQRLCSLSKIIQHQICQPLVRHYSIFSHLDEEEKRRVDASTLAKKDDDKKLLKNINNSVRTKQKNTIVNGLLKNFKRAPSPPPTNVKTTKTMTDKSTKQKNETVSTGKKTFQNKRKNFKPKLKSRESELQNEILSLFEVNISEHNYTPEAPTPFKKTLTKSPPSTSTSGNTIVTNTHTAPSFQVKNRNEINVCDKADMVSVMYKNMMIGHSRAKHSRGVIQAYQGYLQSIRRKKIAFLEEHPEEDFLVKEDIEIYGLLMACYGVSKDSSSLEHVDYLLQKVDKLNLEPTANYFISLSQTYLGLEDPKMAIHYLKQSYGLLFENAKSQYSTVASESQTNAIVAEIYDNDDFMHIYKECVLYLGLIDSTQRRPLEKNLLESTFQKSEILQFEENRDLLMNSFGKEKKKILDNHSFTFAFTQPFDKTLTLLETLINSEVESRIFQDGSNKSNARLLLRLALDNRNVEFAQKVAQKIRFTTPESYLLGIELKAAENKIGAILNLESENETRDWKVLTLVDANFFARVAQRFCDIGSYDNVWKVDTFANNLDMPRTNDMYAALILTKIEEKKTSAALSLFNEAMTSLEPVTTPADGNSNPTGTFALPIQVYGRLIRFCDRPTNVSYLRLFYKRLSAENDNVLPEEMLNSLIEASYFGEDYKGTIFFLKRLQSTEGMKLSDMSKKILVELKKAQASKKRK